MLLIIHIYMASLCGATVSLHAFGDCCVVCQFMLKLNYLPCVPSTSASMMFLAFSRRTLAPLNASRDSLSWMLVTFAVDSSRVIGCSDRWTTSLSARRKQISMDLFQLVLPLPCKCWPRVNQLRTGTGINKNVQATCIKILTHHMQLERLTCRRGREGRKACGLQRSAVGCTPELRPVGTIPGLPIILSPSTVHEYRSSTSLKIPASGMATVPQLDTSIIVSGIRRSAIARL